MNLISKEHLPSLPEKKTTFPVYWPLIEPTPLTFIIDIKETIPSFTSRIPSFFFYILQTADSHNFLRNHCHYYTHKFTCAYMNIPPYTLTKRLEKKLDGNYTRMLRAILNKSWRQHPTRHHALSISVV